MNGKKAKAIRRAVRETFPDPEVQKRVIKMFKGRPQKRDLNPPVVRIGET